MSCDDADDDTEAMIGYSLSANVAGTAVHHIFPRRHGIFQHLSHHFHELKL